MEDDLKQRVYYSQNREDLILESFFMGEQQGFYVDVGANDPVVDSVTRLFYDKGWRGINIEPIKHHFEALQAQRPGDINLNIGVGDKSGKLVFHEFTAGDGLSTFSKAMVKEYAGSDKEVHKHTREYTVEIKPLRDVFETNKVTSIQFMKVDVEGLEYEVLKGNDWTKYRPEVICIEANHIVHDWRPILQDNGYELAFFDGLNEYYTDATTARRAAFNYVENVVLKHNGGLRLGDFGHIMHLTQLNEANQTLIEETQLQLQTASAENAKQNELYQDLLAENHRNHVRSAVAERALRNPLAFIKYQLKRVHHLILHFLSPRKKAPEYTEAELSKKDKALKQLSSSKTDAERLKATQAVASAEISRLQRLYAANHEPRMLRVYLRLVGFVKILRLRKG